MRVVENDRSGCFSITFKDMEESFIDIYYNDNFRDDVIISPFTRGNARDFASVVQKMVERRINHDIKR